MKDIHYISPSILPSESANSVHVIMQVRALADCGFRVTLYACRSVREKKDLVRSIQAQYAVNFDDICMVTCFVKSVFMSTSKVALLALFRLVSNRRPNLIISRNLYATYILGVLLRQPHIFEVHDVEKGIRGYVQRSILKRPWIRIIAISQKLLEYLNEIHGVTPCVSQVLHDAAPHGISPVSPENRRALLKDLVHETKGEWEGICGYIGHLYSGRGIEIIETMASSRSNVLFLIIGGRSEEIVVRRESNKLKNLLYLGHMPHNRALQIGGCVDVLLMPYQTSVSVGVKDRDTAKWMSPMKMFEYLAVGVPIISSSLPVLREILVHNNNALLVRPDAPEEWIAALDLLLKDRTLAARISDTAHKLYQDKYTWRKRAEALLGAI